MARWPFGPWRAGQGDGVEKIDGLVICFLRLGPGSWLCEAYPRTLSRFISQYTSWHEDSARPLSVLLWIHSQRVGLYGGAYRGADSARMGEMSGIVAITKNNSGGCNFSTIFHVGQGRAGLAALARMPGVAG